MEAVVRPQIPYHGPISGGITDGKLINIKGTVPYGVDSFEINLLTGVDSLSDRPLHISVRFHGRTVIRNALERGTWGNEERHGPFPFHSGKDFSMMIQAGSSCYRIAVDNQHCFEFKHRLLMSRVNQIHIDGNVQIERIEFIDSMNPYQPDIFRPYPSVYPGRPCIIPGQIIPGIPSNPSICPSFPSQVIPPAPSICPTFPGQIIPPPEQICPQPRNINPGGSSLSPVYNPSIPYAYPIYGGLKPGMMAYISGRPSASAYRFTLNFQCGTHPYPPPDIAFHFDVRFYNHTIVRNARSNNVWEQEESHISHFPFQQAVNFDLMIRIESNRFMLALNGQHFIEFRHRLQPISRFDTLCIENDIVVSSIRFS